MTLPNGPIKHSSFQKSFGWRSQRWSYPAIFFSGSKLAGSSSPKLLQESVTPSLFNGRRVLFATILKFRKYPTVSIAIHKCTGLFVVHATANLVRPWPSAPPCSQTCSAAAAFRSKKMSRHRQSSCERNFVMAAMVDNKVCVLSVRPVDFVWRNRRQDRRHWRETVLLFEHFWQRSKCWKEAVYAWTCSLPLLSFHSPDSLEVKAWSHWIAPTHQICSLTATEEGAVPFWEALKADAAPSEFQNLMTGKSGKRTKSVFNSRGFSLYSRPFTVSEWANLTKPGSCLRKFPGGGMKT